MAQHDYVISNGTGAAVRSDLNNALLAIVSQNSGATEPTTTYAYQWWADTTTGLLKIRNSANNAWITLRELDGTLTIEDGTVSAPGLAFRDDLNTGIWRPGTDQFAISTNGVERVEWGTSEVVFNDGGTNYDFRVEGDNNASLLFVDASADAVGIGTSSVSSLLHLASSGPVLTLQRSDSASPGAAINFTNNTSGVNWQIGTNQAVGGSAFEINSGNQANNRFVITSGGLVGIGVTSVSNTLHIKQTGDTYGDGIAIQAASGTARRLYIGVDHATGEGAIGTDTHDLRLEATGARSVTFKTNGSERARVDSSGRLLLGTSTAFSTNAKVQVESDTNSKLALKATSAVANNASDIEFYVGSTHKATISGGNNASSSATLTFSTTADGASSPTERARITQAGYLKVSNSGSYTSASGSFHELIQTANDYAIEIYNKNASLTAPVLQVSADRNTTNSTYSLIRASRIGATDCFFVRDSGNVQNTNNSYTGTSDAKLKENIVDATSQWDDIKSLKVRKFNFKEETGNSTHTQIGLIAQEVEIISPGLVDDAIDRDSEGNDLGTVTKSVNYSVLYMKAVKALQEAMERIEQLEAKVAALESA